jgi:hypothetical protein
MQRIPKSLCVVLLLAGLTACSSIAISPSFTKVTQAISIDGQVCMLNQVDALPEANVVDDPAMLALALGASLKGGICAGKTFKVNQALLVYRLWDG